MFKGILQPLLQHKWQLQIKHPDKDVQNLISRQVTKCSIDYVERTLSVSVEQDTISTTLHEVFNELGRMPKVCTVSIQPLCDDKPTSGIEIFGKLISHNFKLDYSKCAVAQHDLVFSISNLACYEMELSS